MNPINILAAQAESAFVCAQPALYDVPRVAGEQLQAWITSEAQDNLTAAQRTELAGLAVLLETLGETMEGKL